MDLPLPEVLPEPGAPQIAVASAASSMHQGSPPMLSSGVLSAEW